ncbi:TRAP transporter small permease [Thermoanaerobacteraceae bacterium SP2]|nr:TRAP transporter small permease [Thermoanaerobacteraceae bacterium SP2]
MTSVFLRFEEKLFKLLRVILSLLVIGLIVVVLAQVVFRYFLKNSLSWSVEASNFLFVWIVFIGAVLGVHDNSHVGLDLVIKAVPEKIRERMNLIANDVVIIFLVILTYYGTKFTILMSRNMAEAMPISYSWLYVSVPVSTILMIIAIFGNNLRRKEGKK